MLAVAFCYLENTTKPFGPKVMNSWELWFAWYPVATKQGTVWFAYVWRRWNNDLNWWAATLSEYSGTDGGWEYKKVGADS